MLDDKKPILIEDLGTTKSKSGRRRWGIFECGYCGNIFKANSYEVKAGRTRSCGCICGEKHNMSSSRFYNIWDRMISRCSNELDKSYHHYGGRGVSVCEEWKSVTNFVNWADSTYVEGMSLDRIDNDGNYEPGNCRWADATTQALNQRMKKNNTSGYRGIYFCSTHNKWKAQISYQKIRYSLGSFNTKEEAIKAREDFIRLNSLPHKT